MIAAVLTPEEIALVKQGTKADIWMEVRKLKSRTIGFLGFGAIARDVSEKLQGFHPRMTAYDKCPDKEAA